MINWQGFIDLIGNNRIKETDHAKLYIEIEQVDDLMNVVKQARNFKIPVYIIGAGTWPHIPIDQINGLLIKNNCRRFDIYAMSGKIKPGMNNDLSHVNINQKLIYAQSGTNMNQLVRFSIEEGLGGLEYHLGLPGTVGGAVYTNAKYAPKNMYVNDFIESISILDKDGEMKQVGAGYFIQRSKSNFTEVEDIILSVVFRLKPEDKKILWERANESTEYRNKK